MELESATLQHQDILLTDFFFSLLILLFKIPFQTPWELSPAESQRPWTLSSCNPSATKLRYKVIRWHPAHMALWWAGDKSDFVTTSIFLC